MPTKIHDRNRRPAKVFLKEWLEYRNISAEQLAGRIETSKSVVSKLINGKQRYNQDWLEFIAYAIDCEVSDLFRDPARPTQDELLKMATPDQLRQALQLIESLKTGTDGE